MIIRVLFLGVGAALRARLAGKHRFAFGCVLHPSLHKRAVQAGRAGLAEGCWVKTWQSHSPVHSSSSSAESHGCSWLLSVTQLICARPCREQLLGEGWPGSWLGQAAGLLGRALGWESRDPGLRSGFFTGRRVGQSPHLSAHGSSISLTSSQDCWKDYMVEWIGECFENICYNRFLLFWYLVLASMWSFSSGRLLSLFLYNSSTKIQLDDSWSCFQLLDTRTMAVPCTGLADAGNAGQPSLGFGSAPAAP